MKWRADPCSWGSGLSRTTVSRTTRAAQRLAEAMLALAVPADCMLCGQPLPWRQRAGVCLPCWAALPWAPGVKLRGGALRVILWAADYEGPFRRLVHALKFEG